MLHRPYPPDWLDDEAAAYLLCLPVSTFREYVAAGALPDGPMYKALGNSMAVPVMRWIGSRIAEELEKSTEAAA